MLTPGVMFFHGNARLHTAARTRALLEHSNWELFHHPSYRSDIAPSDYHPFNYLKNWLRSSASTTVMIDGRCQNVAKFTGGTLL
jgi:hypothetical protein